MNSLVLIIFAIIFFFEYHTNGCIQHKQNKHPALIYGIPWRDTYFDGTRNVSCFTCCPASTERERKINDQVSLTGHSLFLKNIHSPKDNFTVNICDEPLKSSTLYNSESHQYEIGYELCYEEGSFKWDDGAYYHFSSYVSDFKDLTYSIYESKSRWLNADCMMETPKKFQLGTNNYHIYRSVNNENRAMNKNKNEEIILNNGSSKLIFLWAPVIYVTSSRISGYNKQIQIQSVYILTGDGSYERTCRSVLYKPSDEIIDALRYKCDDHGFLRIDMKIYTSSEVDDNSTKLKIEAVPSIEKLVPWNEQSRDSLELSQIIPHWYYNKHLEKAASCSYTNMVPIWKSIADGQLRKVDLYILAVARYVNDQKLYRWMLHSLYFGASGVLTYKNESGIDSNQQRKLYSMPVNSSFNQIIPVPKIIYRVIEAEYSNAWYSAIIVIHNDPNPILENDRVCTEWEELAGWERIKNDDPRTGITYVCPYAISKIAHVKLGFQTVNDLTKSIRLDNMPYYKYDGWFDWDMEHDAREKIDSEFQKLLK